MARRLIDLLMLAMMGPFAIILMIGVGLIVRLKLGSPIFFSQERGGFQGKVFRIFKFRSMSNACDSKGDLLSDNERLGQFGKFIRSTSLDELPCLLNILRGDMTLIGPRPFIADYLEFYNSYQMKRHDVVPGITGWAQVNGRNALTWEEKFELDLWYIEHRSLILDLRIVWLTMAKLLKREDIEHSQDVPMPRFKGSRS